MTDTFWMAVQAFVGLALLYLFLLLVFRAYFQAKLDYACGLVDMYISMKAESIKATEKVT